MIKSELQAKSKILKKYIHQQEFDSFPISKVLSIVILTKVILNSYYVTKYINIWKALWELPFSNNSCMGKRGIQNAKHKIDFNVTT